MIARLFASNQWRFFSVLPEVGRTLALAWWGVFMLRGVLPALLALDQYLTRDGSSRTRSRPRTRKKTIHRSGPYSEWRGLCRCSDSIRP
jgi:hypothetical protein